MNLRTKLHLATASLVLVIVVGMMSSLYISEKKELFQEVRQEQRDDLSKLEAVYGEAMIVGNEILLFNYVKTLAILPKVAYAGFVESQTEGSGTRRVAGWIHTGGNTPLIFADSGEAGVGEILRSTRFLRRVTVGPRGKPVIEITKPIVEGPPDGRRPFIRLAYDRDVVNEAIAQRLNRSLRKLTVAGFVAIAFGLLLAHLLSRALARPIFNLMSATQAIAAGEKGITIPEAGKDELGRLTKTFNHMSLELVKLDQLKDDFMSHVTHELRSPLTSIIATVELMDEMPIADANPKVRRSIDRLKYGSERLNRLVDNILDLTRMEAGKMQFDIQPTNLGTIVCEMADFFEPRAMEKNLYIRADVPREIPQAFADGEKIRQVLSNLIHNAIKFTNDGGITVWVKSHGNEIRVGVQDTGVGIPPEKIKSVFEKFETLKDTRDRVKKPVPGSGLGLNIVKNSLKNQNGRIWVESEINVGTTFIFALPIAKDLPRVKPVRAQVKAEPETSPAAEPSSVRQPIMMQRPEQAV